MKAVPCRTSANDVPGPGEAVAFQPAVERQPAQAERASRPAHIAPRALQGAADQLSLHLTEAHGFECGQLCFQFGNPAAGQIEFGVHLREGHVHEHRGRSVQDDPGSASD